jgi:hypothetical protein
LAEKITELLRDLSTNEEQQLLAAGIEFPKRDLSNVTINRYENNPQYQPTSPQRHWFLAWALARLGGLQSVDDEELALMVVRLD